MSKPFYTRKTIEHQRGDRCRGPQVQCKYLNISHEILPMAFLISLLTSQVTLFTQFFRASSSSLPLQTGLLVFFLSLYHMLHNIPSHPVSANLPSLPKCHLETTSTTNLPLPAFPYPLHEPFQFPIPLPKTFHQRSPHKHPHRPRQRPTKRFINIIHRPLLSVPLIYFMHPFRPQRPIRIVLSQPHYPPPFPSLV